MVPFSSPSMRMEEHRLITISGAPFITSRFSSPLRSSCSPASWIDIWYLMSELKGISVTFFRLFLGVNSIDSQPPEWFRVR